MVPGAFGGVGQLDERTLHARAAARALQREPLAEFAADVLGLGAEHVVRVGEVVFDAGGERERRVAVHQFGAELAAQLEEALAQRVACGVRRALGPEQLGQAGAWRRPFEREPGEQRRVARRQLDRRATRHDDTGLAGELEQHGRPCYLRPATVDPHAVLLPRRPRPGAGVVARPALWARYGCPRSRSRGRLPHNRGTTTSGLRRAPNPARSVFLRQRRHLRRDAGPASVERAGPDGAGARRALRGRAAGLRSAARRRSRGRCWPHATTRRSPTSSPKTRATTTSRSSRCSTTAASAWPPAATATGRSCASAACRCAWPTRRSASCTSASRSRRLHRRASACCATAW